MVRVSKGILIKAIFLIFVLSACSQGKVLTIYDKIDNESPPNSIEELIGSGDVIIKGHFTHYLESVNMITSDEEGKVPSEDFYYEGRVFNFHITEYYKGQSPTSISVLIPYEEKMDIFNERGRYITTVTLPNLDYEEPDPEKEYILLLSENPTVENGYSLAHELYQIEISAEKNLKFVSKRIKGDLDYRIRLNKSEDEQSEEIVYQFRDGRAIDYHQQVIIYDNLVENMTEEDFSKIFEKN
ncbi:hypothetical protein [Alkalihalobacillus trypoxylicola]|uniref:Uncharacterized protein n=1 Tax=Alkalihalobacillus trypoxylicola TaxID=519424 RepID=A0A162F7C8_9BACI|nr:hypothetical protein [Alkalihalobacillus trypoxylicola]KYG34960.1 hypothetical protein AZF04_01100 [Alkalihalobacillus trypoxylicola]